LFRLVLPLFVPLIRLAPISNQGGSKCRLGTLGGQWRREFDVDQL
jgi:hypothetical protein